MRGDGRLDDPRTCWAVLGAAMALYAALALWLTRGTTLFVDESNLFTQSDGVHPGSLLAPLNGHLVLLQRLFYAVDFRLFGADFAVARVAEVLGVVLVVGLVFTMARRRVGPAVALAPAVLLLFLGSAWELNFVVSGLGNVYAVAAGLGALLALERRDRWGDLLACALLVVAVASFTLGAAFVLGAVVLVLLDPGRWRRIWVVAVPIALYVAWLAWIRAVYVPAHGEVQDLHLSNLLLAPNFFADEAASVAGAVAGLNYDFHPHGTFAVFATSSQYGPVLAAIAVAALVWRIRRGPRPPLLWALIAILLAFWLALALGFGAGRDPGTVRYVYGGAIVAVLIAAEAARGVRLGHGAVIALFAIVALALFANVARLRDGMRYYRSFATGLRAQLTAIELARDRVDPGFVPATGPAHFDIVTAGPYLAAVDRNGSPAYSPSTLAVRPEGERHVADETLVGALRITVTPVAHGGSIGACRNVSSGVVTVRAPGVRLTSDTAGHVAVRRFASTATADVGAMPAGRPVRLRIPSDRSSRPWTATVGPSPSVLRVCDLVG